VGQGGRRSLLFLSLGDDADEMMPDCASLSYSAAPSSGFSSASLCSPTLGAADLERARRCPTWRNDAVRRHLSPMSSSGISISDSRSST